MLVSEFDINDYWVESLEYDSHCSYYTLECCIYDEDDIDELEPITSFYLVPEYVSFDGEAIEILRAMPRNFWRPSKDAFQKETKTPL